MPSDVEGPEAVYTGRAEAFGAETRAWTAQFNRFANLRFVAFAASAALLIWGVVQAAPLAIGGGVACGIAFVALVQRHRWLGRRRDRAIALQAINQQAIHRLRREWDAVPVRHSPQVEAAHAYAADLDVFGHASLMHLLDTTGTSMGGATLARWLLDAAPPDCVHERQRAMLELAPRLELRQELEASGGSQLDPEPFLSWAESAPWMRRQGWVVWAARLSPALLCLLGLAQLAGLIAGPWWAVFLFVNAFVWQRAGRLAYITLSRIEHQQAAFQQYAAGFDLLNSARFEAQRLQQLLGLLTSEGRSASSQMRSLERITRFVIPRGAQVYWVLQPVLLWDVHVLAALEAWQVSNGSRVRTWLETLGEIEALAAFAALAHAHPDWAVPEIDAHAERLDAEQAGHPLLPPDVRVDNDIHLGPPATFLLVTGSNMAGKSTYLRTIGSNIVLAQAGGPVCARAWRMPPLALWTSMRVVDSLERGVSTFLAEVLRLKQVVDAARTDGRAAQPSVCFLLDEILQGTNTLERQVAARRVIRFLIARNAVGAVSTHDLTLVEDPALQAAARLVHFSETLTEGAEGPLMTFDHRLRSGLATSTNALRLVAMLGLE